MVTPAQKVEFLLSQFDVDGDLIGYAYDAHELLEELLPVLKAREETTEYGVIPANHFLYV